MDSFAATLSMSDFSNAHDDRSSRCSSKVDEEDAAPCPWCMKHSSHASHTSSLSGATYHHDNNAVEHDNNHPRASRLFAGSDLMPTWSRDPSIHLKDYTSSIRSSTPINPNATADPEKGVRAPVSTAFNIRDNPDGGAQAWRTVFGGFLTLFCSFGWLNTIGVWQAYYQTHQLAAHSSSAVAWIPSLEMFCMFFFGPWAGDFLDRYGPRYLMAAGTVLHVFGLCMTSLSTRYYQFVLAQGIVSPLGVCMLFYAAMGTIPSWFLRKRAFAFGIVASGSSLGGVILPIMTQRLIETIGFGWSMRVTALFILYLLTIANFTVTSRMPKVKKPVSLLAYVSPLRELPFALVTFGAFLFVLGFLIPLNFVITEATHYGMSEGLAQYLVSILNAVSLFGRIIPGYLADSLGRFNVMIVCCFGTSLLILAVWIPATSNVGIVLFAALFGFFSGAFVSMCNSVIAEITTDMRQMGIRTGTFYAIFAIGALISSPIGGALIAAWDGSYVGLQIFAGVMCFCGALCITAARVAVSGPSLTAKV